MAQQLIFEMLFDENEPNASKKQLHELAADIAGEASIISSNIDQGINGSAIKECCQEILNDVNKVLEIVNE